jgi:hypothetical protein
MTRPNNATKFILRERERERENEFKEINYKGTLKKIVRKSKDTQILKQGAEKMEKSMLLSVWLVIKHVFPSVRRWKNQRMAMMSDKNHHQRAT